MLWIDDLVAADGPEVRLLKLEGIDCECAPTGMLGLARAFGARWNAIVLDLRLPDMDGLGVLRWQTGPMRPVSACSLVLVR